MHALGFRVMRLCKPRLQEEGPLRLDLDADLSSDWRPTSALTAADIRSTPFADRVIASKPSDQWGLDGLLELPQSVGSIYLGEAFTSYISIVNNSGDAVTSVGIKAELQTERQKTVLHDGTTSPLASLSPGSRHDFIVSHDVKEVGPHTLVCSTTYTAADGERKYMPQYFKFASHNPLSVRTKTRSVGAEAGQPQVLLEACVENMTQSSLFLEYVRFDAVAGLTASHVAAKPLNVTPASRGSPSAAVATYVQRLQLLDPGGAANVVYSVAMPERTSPVPTGKQDSPPAAATAAPPLGSSALGKLEIKWRSTLGGTGRLQTQQIQAPSPITKEVELRVVTMPGKIHVEQPFAIDVAVRRLQNAAPAALGPLSIVPVTSSSAAGELPDKQGSEGAIVVLSQSPSSIDLHAAAEATVALTLLPLRCGVQQVPALSLVHAHSRSSLDTLHLSVMVHTAPSGM